jgi:hypothetical protein
MEICVTYDHWKTAPPPTEEDLAQPDDDLPTMTCPKCGAEEPDFDGFGMLSHTKPAYPNGCGYCTCPSRDGDGKGNWVCGSCGATEAA